ncbi:MAG: formylmethanofuran dehydrogenase subunit D [Pirellulaceae bacterium]|jgi:formylmethanofuran dehydrogenase subunit D
MQRRWDLLLKKPMSTDIFILIPGRTSKQGVGISEGKYKKTYQNEINNLHLSPEDMERLKLSDGDRVRVTSEFGEIEINVMLAKDDLPPGLLFLPYGDMSSRLMGGDTHGTGMPTSKGIDVELSVLS